MENLNPPKRSELIKLFGEIKNEKWIDESKHMGVFYVPTDISKFWHNAFTGHNTSHIYCNKILHAPLSDALRNVREKRLLTEIKTFDGCFNIRKVRGSETKISIHSYGLAIDINAKENPLGGPVEFTAEFVKCFTKEGFIWGGDFSRIDGQHFQWCIEE